MQGISRGVLLGDGGVVEHGHSFDTQQHSQTPRHHVVEDNGAEGGRETSHETRPTAHAQTTLCAAEPREQGQGAHRECAEGCGYDRFTPCAPGAEVRAPST